MSNPLIDMLMESLPLPGRTATWEPQLDLTGLYLDTIGKLSIRMSEKMARIELLVLLWEMLRRAKYSDTTTVFNLRKWNLLNIAVLSDPNDWGGPKRARDLLLMTSLATKRLKIESYPLMEADTLFGMEHDPGVPQLPRGAGLRRKLALLAKSAILSMKGVKELYDEMEEIYESTKSLELPQALARQALRFPLEFDYQHFVLPLHDEINPQQRFLKLADSARTLQSQSAAFGDGIEKLREIDKRLRTGLVKTADDAEVMNKDYGFAMGDVLQRVVIGAGVRCEDPSSRLTETLSTDSPLRIFDSDIRGTSADVVRKVWSHTFMPALQSGPTFGVTMQNGRVQKILIRAELKKLVGKEDLLSVILCMSCLIDPVLNGQQNLSSLVSEIIPVGKGLGRGDLERDLQGAEKIARSAPENLTWAPPIYEKLKNILRGIVSE